MSDRVALRWAFALERVFAGEPVSDPLPARESESHFFVTYVPGKDSTGRTRLAVGYAFRQPAEAMIPESGVTPGYTHEMEDFGLGMRQFLHDELAQALTAAGLQLDLLRLDVEERVPDLASRTAEIQRLLDDTLRRVRDVSSRVRDVSSHAPK